MLPGLERTMIYLVKWSTTGLEAVRSRRFQTPELARAFVAGLRICKDHHGIQIRLKTPEGRWAPVGLMETRDAKPEE